MPPHAIHALALAHGSMAFEASEEAPLKIPGYVPEHINQWVDVALAQATQLVVLESRSSPITKKPHDLGRLNVPRLEWTAKPGSGKNIFDMPTVLANLLRAADFRAQGRPAILSGDTADALVGAVFESPSNRPVRSPVPADALHTLQLHLAQILDTAGRSTCRLTGYEYPRMPVSTVKDLISALIPDLLLLEKHARDAEAPRRRPPRT